MTAFKDYNKNKREDFMKKGRKIPRYKYLSLRISEEEEEAIEEEAKRRLEDKSSLLRKILYRAIPRLKALAKRR